MSPPAYVPSSSAPLLPAMRDSIPDWLWPVALVLIAMWVFLMLRLFWRIRATGNQSSDALRARISDPQQLYMIGPAVVELRRRGEPLGPCWNRLVKLATSTDRVERMLGWQALQRGFPQRVAGLAYEPRHAPREERLALRARLLEEAPSAAESAASPAA